MTRLWTGAPAAALAAAAMLWTANGQAQQAPPAPQAQAQVAAPDAPLPWPRDFDLPDNQLLQLYQPQVDSWNGDQMAGRAAVAIGPKASAPTYGMVRFSARVAIDKPAGIVHFATLSIDGVEVPTEPAKAAVIRSALQSRLPQGGMTIPLDQLQASYAVNQELAKLKTQPVDNAPPQILFATSATILIPVAGDPVLRPIKGVSGFRRVINTRPLLLLDDAGTYHLEAAGHWYETPNLSGTWIVTPQVPDALAAAGKAANAEIGADPLLSSEHKPIDPAPAIIVATKPAELIQTEGQPQMLPVVGTNLLSMNNADHAVFMETTSNSYFVLISGRWFKAPDLKGPWTFIAANALPKDFAKISPNDPKANVLVSVAGTPQAKEAAIAATIPQTASVKRTVDLKVAYDGQAKFEPIAGTQLAYAVNTPTPVIRLDAERFYAVNDGAWFVATSAAGPWRVADVVPDVIYTIPVSSPVHYVTYVRIYGTTPDAVVVGYTPGYMGVVVAPDGTVVYGSGYTCPGYVGTYWFSCPVTYGVGAGFALGIDTGFAFGFATGWAWGAAVWPAWGPYWHPWGPGPWGPWGPHPYGPYGPWGGHWGYTNINQTNIYGRWGGAATVNHAWGTTWNGTEWSGRDWHGTTAGDTHFAGRSGAAFNPYSGNYAAGRENARYNPETGARGESRAGVAGNAYTGNAVAGRESAGVNPTTGTAHASQTTVTDKDGNVNVNSRGVAANARTDTAAAWHNGNVVVDHDGNVYKHTDNGGWSRNTGSGWQNVDRNADTSALDNESRARSWGDQRVSSYGGDGFGGDAYGRGDSFGGDRYGSGGFDRDFGGYGGGDRFGGDRFGGGFGGGFGGMRGGFGGGFGRR
ncbi:carbohydrate-binding family V/XII [Xanthobacter sp. KR7-65]|uniref:carbohydrate-binding family V/XII n=1 Tax=Xanthobacter sp. KR7-65 TaxID=3156612 RepID=UPI0032B3D39E